MTDKEVDRLWGVALHESVTAGQMFTRYRFAALVAEAEREACCSIVYGQCGSDNVAQRTVDAIKARGRWVKTYSGGVPNYTTGGK
jgi:hypothetical protein